jgi:flagellar secretion chaperone FliS
MTAYTDARTAYQGNAISTATAAQRLVMLWDRLVLDIERGLRAQMRDSGPDANQHLQHAQAILTEFQSTLEVDGWTGGRELMALYGYIQRRLIQANVRQDQRATKEALILCRNLRDTWTRAATLAAEA